MLFKMLQAAPGPAQGQLQGLQGTPAVSRVFRAFIEGHDDVGSERHLHVHGVLGREEMGGAIQVGSKPHPFFAHLA